MWKASSRIVSQSKHSFQHGKLVSHRNVTGRQSKSSSATTLLTIGGAAVVTIIGGSVAAAKSSEGFRNFSEKYIPGTPSLYNLILGPKETKVEKPILPEDGLLKKKLERDALKKKNELLIIKSEGSSPPETPALPEIPVASELDITTKEPDVSPVKEIPVVVVAEEAPINSELNTQEENVIQEPTTTEEVPVETNIETPIAVEHMDFPTLLSKLQTKAADAVGQAVEAQDKAASAIKKHVEMVLKSLEMIYEPGQTPGNVWEPVFQATQEKNDAVLKAETKAKEARMAVAELKETVAHCLKNDEGGHSPDLITLDESVARALYSLETAKARVDAAQSEAKVMDEYRELVDTARHHLQMELSSIRPELAPAFQAQDAKLGDEELNILMAHAYWKIITLQKELSKQQSLEQQRLKSALDTQRKEDFVSMESRLRVELERQYYELKAQYGHDIANHEKILSEQFMQQLKRQAAAHSDHLSDQLTLQEGDLTRKFEGERELQLAGLRMAQLEELTKLNGMAKGIRDAVHTRADKDKLSRDVRELWLAAQSLIDCLHSNATVHLPWEEQRRPLTQPIQALSNLTNNNDDFTQSIIQSIPEAATGSGILPQGAIKERFLNIERICRRVALIDENGGSLIRYALSYLQSLMVVKVDIRTPPKNAEDEEIDLGKLNTFDILARTRYHLEKDDLEQALRYMNLLRGEPQHIAEDWLKELRVHLETVQAAQAIQTYAAAQAIESM